MSIVPRQPRAAVTATAAFTLLACTLLASAESFKATGCNVTESGYQVSTPVSRITRILLLAERYLTPFAPPAGPVWSLRQHLPKGRRQLHVSHHVRR